MNDTFTWVVCTAAGHRMWALQRLRKLLTTEFGQSININRLLGESEGEAHSMVSTRRQVWLISLILYFIVNPMSRCVTQAETFILLTLLSVVLRFVTVAIVTSVNSWLFILLLLVHWSLNFPDDKIINFVSEFHWKCTGSSSEGASRGSAEAVWIWGPNCQGREAAAS